MKLLQFIKDLFNPSEKTLQYNLERLKSEEIYESYWVEQLLTGTDHSEFYEHYYNLKLIRKQIKRIQEKLEKLSV